MCEQCREPNHTPDVTIIDPDLEPDKAAEAKRKGSRYVFGSSFADPNVRDAIKHATPTPYWSIPASAWERIFG